MAAFGAGVLGQIVWTLSTGLGATVEVMGAIGLLALGANVACLALLARHRLDDVNMRSAWICSRNDVVGNVGRRPVGLAVARHRHRPRRRCDLRRVVRPGRRQGCPRDGDPVNSAGRAPGGAAWGRPPTQEDG
jgi:hypothetical protein